MADTSIFAMKVSEVRGSHIVNRESEGLAGGPSAAQPIIQLLVVEQVVPSGLVRKEKGASLIEVLVAVVILSIGILGIAGIQIVVFSKIGEHCYA